MKGGVRSGHQSLKPHPRASGRSKKSGSGHATSQAEVLRLLVNRVDGEGQPEGRAMIVATGQDDQHRGGYADVSLGQPGEDGSERHTRRQGRDTNPTLISPGMDEATVSSQPTKSKG